MHDIIGQAPVSADIAIILLFSASAATFVTKGEFSLKEENLKKKSCPVPSYNDVLQTV